MSNVSQKRTRSERVASVRLPPGRMSRLVTRVRDPDVLVRTGLCVVAALLIWLVVPDQTAPLAYRLGHTPQRDITTRVAFEVPNPQATETARQRARRQARAVYEQEPEPLVQIRAELQNKITRLLSVASVDEVDPAVWSEFRIPPAEGEPPPGEQEARENLETFRTDLAGEMSLDAFAKALTDAFAPLEQKGVLRELQHEPEDGNQKEIFVYFNNEDPTQRQVVQVEDVLLGRAVTALHKRLRENLPSAEVADHVFAWLQPRLSNLEGTLRLDPDETNRVREEAVAAVKPQMTRFEPGQPLARRGQPITPTEMRLLQAEHKQWEASATSAERATRSLSTLALIGALFGLCGYFMVTRQRAVVDNLKWFTTLLGMIVVTMALTRWFSTWPSEGERLPLWRAELLPLLLFAMLTAITYNQQTAILVSGALALLVMLAFDHALGQFVVAGGVLITTILMLGRIRGRSKLLVVGSTAGLVGALLTVAVGVLDAQPLSGSLWLAAAHNFLWALAAGFLLTGLLPFIERFFGVVTEQSLLELGDVAHPLLQELVRRAPGTYNHSINVASIAEAAADAIGASGLLVRVGAYFHDIGKMLKPGYFVENQGEDANRHESLMPAMSTLIIIAHVKDGADLARQHRLPQMIIDFIEQHHGTTLVEYFFHRASQQSEENESGAVDENTFRYPGPKPQTKESAVLMLADAVEGASRALVEPTPARLENLVRDISMKRLLDGQFDESGLNLRELQTIENSLVKSLTAIHHGRIKYPSQQTA